jgi:hypothetical protein
MRVDGETTFCSPKFGVKFKNRNMKILIFWIDKSLYGTMKNQIGNKVGMTFFQIVFVFNLLKSLKIWWC